MMQVPRLSITRPPGEILAFAPIPACHPIDSTGDPGQAAEFQNDRHCLRKVVLDAGNTGEDLWLVAKQHLRIPSKPWYDLYIRDLPGNSSW